MQNKYIIIILTFLLSAWPILCIITVIVYIINIPQWEYVWVCLWHLVAHFLISPQEGKAQNLSWD